MNDKNLDEQIKKALENFQEPFQDEHWRLMEQELNDPANADLAERMDDHLLRAKLSQINPKPDPTHWESLAAKMAVLSSEPLLEDVMMDGVSYENLKDLQSPYQKEHWNLMEAKIEAELGWKNKVVRYKLVEISLALLFLFTFLQYWPNAKEIIPRIIKQSNEPIAIENADNQSPLENKAAVITKLTTATETENLGTQNATVPNAEVQAYSSKLADGLLEGAQSGSFAGQLLSKAKYYSKPSDLSSSGKKLLTERKNISVDPIPQVSEVISLQPLVEEKSSEEEIYVPGNYIFAGFAMLANMDQGLLDEPKINLPGCDDCFKERTPSFLRIGMVGTASFDFVHTNKAPTSTLNRQTQDVALSSLRQGEFGYGGGLSIGVRKNRWEIETGVSYVTRVLEPEVVNVFVDRGSLINGYTGYGWIGSQLDLVQVPLNLRYDFVDKAKWKIYGQTGLSLNMAFNAIDRYEEFYYAPHNTRGALELTNDPFTYFTSNNEGISAGGSIYDNSYLNLNLGFGVERQFNERYSIFMQPSYHYLLSPNGVKNTGLKINSASIQTGVKISLKKRNKTDLQTPGNTLLSYPLRLR